MVWSGEREADRPPLSLILPGLYLGAERDVTQGVLSSLGISYVCSVSRCSPQPSFLPACCFLRIPIDDSLRDNLLPFIPQALHFIDAAVSSGGSVLIHCAAGISRSPALAVAYIMSSLHMDLDQAYRFVKERRPSISPNFNFLGQLQHFQATLGHRTTRDSLASQDQEDQHRENLNLDKNLHQDQDQSLDLEDQEKEDKDREDLDGRLSCVVQSQQSLCSSEDSWLQDRLHLPVQSACGDVRPCQLVQKAPPLLQLPPSSLLEKRKSLTLSLSPVGVAPPGPASRSPSLSPATGSSRERGDRLQQQRSCRRAEAKNPPLAPLSLSLSRLLGCGEKVLFGGFLPPVRMGQPALPYRC